MIDFSILGGMFVRLAIAAVLGALLGFERTHAGKNAGVRTYSLVSLGSALFVVVSELVVIRYFNELRVTLDPLRVASQVVMGIGFLGTGLIIFKESRINGLTTAAGLWVAAGIGVSAGFGFIALAIFSTILTFLVFTLLWLFEKKIKPAPHEAMNHNDQKGFVIPVLIVIAVLITGGYFLYSRNDIRQEASIVKNPNTQIPNLTLSPTISVEKLPAGVNEKILFSHYNFKTNEAELYLVGNKDVKLLTKHKTPDGFSKRFYGKVSPNQKKIVYKLTTGGSGADFGNDYTHKITYDQPGSEGLYYTPKSPIFIANLDGSDEKVLVSTDGKQDIPRFIWSPDSRYLFYNVVDYATQKDVDQGFQMAVGVWQVDTLTGQNILLYQGEAVGWDIFDYYLIGYDNDGQSLLVPRRVVTGKFPYDQVNWQIAKIKVQTGAEKIDPSNNFNVFATLARSEPSLFSSINLMNNDNLAYVLPANRNRDSREIDFGLIGPIGNIEIIFSQKESDGFFYARSLNDNFILVAGIKNKVELNGIYDSAGKKTNLKVFQRNDLSTNIDMLIGMLPVSKYWVGNYTSQKDSRGLNEFGLFVGSPDSSNVSFITKDNAQFVDWLE